ncbi:hypothetical protein [Paenibacillus sp. URB8-2]|uniref:hypothetical protein n=1 Tax=Paenibacillus sp. URB8-2 TaxID=2741301 RepID=UPI0015C1D466|nr:hypothetical protein [Paenibacillus sp. URB8-2]BCG58161.1 hypothetical protein PUR_15860 [Paenibacillus sp. URB8-2]
MIPIPMDEIITITAIAIAEASIMDITEARMISAAIPTEDTALAEMPEAEETAAAVGAETELAASVIQKTAWASINNQIKNLL